MDPRQKIPSLPQLLERKLYKTGQTRGADDDEIYQNRVSRNSTVLMPYAMWTKYHSLMQDGKVFENGFIVLISPDEYFSHPNKKDGLAASGLILGENTLVFYETRESWYTNNPTSLNWQAAESRRPPLGGQYVARIPATTALDVGAKIIHGFSGKNKGAGIRVYEYASSETISRCRNQLEAIIWLCADVEKVLTQHGMSDSAVLTRKTTNLEICREQGLLDLDMLEKMRIINRQGRAVCPLCLKELSAQGFLSRLEQAEGRKVLDLTVTELNLFHIEELRFGVFGHKPYNLGWGHHHCNVVVKDSGIRATLEWMKEVLLRNKNLGSYSINDSIDN
jgi:hypothetical protein